MTVKERIERAVEALPPLPFPLTPDQIGPPDIRETEVPGIYRVERFSRLHPETMEDRCYMHASTMRRAREVFSEEVIAMGCEDDELWIAGEKCGCAVEYELCRYRQRTVSGPEHAMLERGAINYALLGCEDEAAYFGEWSPPERTPCGRRTRYRQADQGVWFVEGGGTWFLAAVSPLLSYLEDDTLGVACPCDILLYPYAFWRLEACALAVYQFLYDGNREGLRAWITSKQDLVNAIWRAHPDFARRRQDFAEIVKNIDEKCGQSKAYSWLEFTRTGPGDRAFLVKMDSPP